MMIVPFFFFPDGSKYCFTCCQFNRCNASPHYGISEMDEINLDELTKEKAGEKKSPAISTRPRVALVGLLLVLLWVALS